MSQGKELRFYSQCDRKALKGAKPWKYDSFPVFQRYHLLLRLEWTGRAGLGAGMRKAASRMPQRGALGGGGGGEEVIFR